MILHLHTDSRFARYTIDLFDSKANIHLVGKRFTWQKSKNISGKSRVEEYVFGWSKPKNVIKSIKPSLVIVHFLDVRWSELISRIESHVPIVWIFWGGDGYGLPKMNDDLYGPLTRSYLQKSNPTSKLEKMKADLNVKSVFNASFLASVLFEFIRVVRSNFSSDKSRIELFERVDYCGTFLKEDYDLLVKKYQFKMKWIDARFISLEKLIGTAESTRLTGNNLLLGNSCTVENNHLDALQLIASLELGSSKVICPLSYGKNLGSYRDKVIEVGRSKLGDSFRPLIDLLSLEDYTDHLKSCAFAIMFHKRQQAFNNILALIYLGVKVYLNPDNTIYSFLKRIGCEVFSTEELTAGLELQPLNKQQIKNNQAVLKKEFSQYRIEKSAKNLLSLIKETNP